MFDAGDIVRFFSPIAGKEKFHLCLGYGRFGPAFAFLYLNSNAGFRGDYVLPDGEIAGLPKSPTGDTVVSFSMVIRMGEERLTKFGATRTGRLNAHIAGELAAFAKTVPTLTRAERSLVVASFESLFS
jgi:hypothetical protein